MNTLRTNFHEPLFIDRLVELPIKLTTSTISHLAKGILQTAIFTPLSILTLGLSRSINENAGKKWHTNHLALVTPIFLTTLVETLNPQAFEEEDTKLPILAQAGLPASSFIKKTKDTNSQEDETIEPFANRFITSPSFFKRHFVSRLCYTGWLINRVIVRAVLLPFAAVATCFMFLTLGKFKSLNRFAIVWLNPLAIIPDVCHGIRGILNPLQFKQPKEYSRKHVE